MGICFKHLDIESFHIFVLLSENITAKISLSRYFEARNYKKPIQCVKMCSYKILLSIGVHRCVRLHVENKWCPII